VGFNKEAKETAPIPNEVFVKNSLLVKGVCI
jgi:hypothetical protein